jgi:hypothetical protein
MTRPGPPLAGRAGPRVRRHPNRTPNRSARRLRPHLEVVPCPSSSST